MTTSPNSISPFGNKLRDSDRLRVQQRLLELFHRANVGLWRAPWLEPIRDTKANALMTTRRAERMCSSTTLLDRSYFTMRATANVHRPYTRCGLPGAPPS